MISDADKEAQALMDRINTYIFQGPLPSYYILLQVLATCLATQASANADGFDEKHRDVLYHDIMNLLVEHGVLVRVQ